MIPLPWWLRLLIWVGVLCGLTVWILAGRHIAIWWRRSPTARCLRWQLDDLRAAMSSPFRLLRERPSKTTAGAGASPTPAPAVPHDVEVPRDGDQ